MAAQTSGVQQTLLTVARPFCLRGQLCFPGKGMNPNNPIQLARLIRSLEYSRQELSPFCRQRTKMLGYLAGNRYADSGEMSQPIPYLKLVYSTFIRSLVSSSPRGMFSTKVPQLKPIAHAMGMSINHRIDEMRLADTIRTVVGDALVSLGIVKTGICYYQREGTGGLTHDYMKPYVDAISLDDWVHDVRARRPDQFAFCGHRYLVPREALLQSNMDQHVINSLLASQRTQWDEYGDAKASSLSSKNSPFGGDTDLEDMLELWEIWLPRQGLVVTLPAMSHGGVVVDKILKLVEYTGPEQGPYHFLRFGEIPDNIMPSPPLLDLADLHCTMNGVHRKLSKQGLRQKTILACLNGTPQDVKGVIESADGTATNFSGSEVPQEVRYGGIDQAGLAFFNQLAADADRYAGNLSSLAGLGPGADTLGQDQMLTASASKQIQGMQESTVAFTRDVLYDLAWYWWRDGEAHEVEVPIQGTDIIANVTITPEMREGTWLKLNFQMQPYSMQADSPGQRLNTIMQLLQNTLMPLTPVMMQQGMMINVQGLVRKVAELSNMPDLDDIIMFQEPQPTDMEMQEEPRMPGSTNRTYTRVSRTGATQQGQDHSRVMAALGAASEQQEGSLGRSVA